MDPQKLSNQERLLSNLEEVKRELSRNPDVLAVGIGTKETGHEFTNEIAYKVFVRQKKSKSSLRSEELIPSQIQNIKTDVITPYVVSERPGVCGTERETLAKKRPLRAGIAISSDSLTYGTLGWFGFLDADDTPILLTNKHVLYNTSSEIRTDKLPTAQPLLDKVSNCCCCECGSDNVIGESIIGIKDTAVLTPTSVDCAIAKINPEFASDIILNIANDATTQVLSVSNTAAAVVGETVRKIGARSGFTTGIVAHIGDAAVAGTDPAGGTITIMSGQVLVIPDPTETYQVDDAGTCKFAFSNSGDSGSVILNSSDEIVALLWGGDETTNSVDITFSNNINNVLNVLSTNSFPIRLRTSPSTGSRTHFVNPVKHRPKKLNRLEKLRDANKESILYHLYEKHFKEVLELVNHCRPVTVAWQRNQGPAFAAALGRAAKVPEYQIPTAIEGCTRQQLLAAMESTLMENGSEALREDLRYYSKNFVQATLWGRSIDEMTSDLKNEGLIDTLPHSQTSVLL